MYRGYRTVLYLFLHARQNDGHELVLGSSGERHTAPSSYTSPWIPRGEPRAREREGATVHAPGELESCGLITLNNKLKGPYGYVYPYIVTVSIRCIPYLEMLKWRLQLTSVAGS